MDYQLALATAIAAAEEAGRLLLDEYHRPGGPRGALGACPVDSLAEELIRNRLEQAFPDHGIVSEELGERDRAARDAGRHVWVIDPNDGTRAFQCGWRGSSVSIGLLRAGAPVLGVVYAYAARAGRGDLVAWADGGVLTRNGKLVAPAWPGRPIPRPERIGAEPGLLERAQGCLLGQLAGDNLGALVEFSNAESLARAWPSGPERLVDGGFWNIGAGQPTDDSELALILARAILTVGGYDRRGAANAYVSWLASRPFDVGGTIGASLGAGLRAASSAGGRCEAVLREARRHTSSQANAALMRIAPLGIYGHALPDHRLAVLARQDAELTHAHAACEDANAVYVIAIAEAIRSGAALSAVYDHALAWARAHAASDVVEALGAAHNRPPAATAPIGWVLVALQHAFHQLLHATMPADGIIATVRAGGDTDTTAAITGALLGAVHGINAMPAQWAERVRTCRSLRGAVETAHPRPRAFWPVDFETVAEQLVTLALGGKR